MNEETKRKVVHAFVFFLAIVTGLPIALWLHVLFIRLAIEGCYP